MGANVGAIIVMDCNDGKILAIDKMSRKIAISENVGLIDYIIPLLRDSSSIVRDHARNTLVNLDLVAVIEIRVSRETARKRIEALGDFNKDVFCHAMDLYEETIKEIEEFYNHDGLLRVINGERNASAVIEDIDEFLQYKVALEPA